MKVILKTKDGFEKTEEVENFHPIIEQVVYTTPEGTIHTHKVADISHKKRTFMFDKEERIFYYKEI